MNRYFVSYMAVYSVEVEADSPEEAADIVANMAPSEIDVEGTACVTNTDTGEVYAEV